MTPLSIIIPAWNEASVIEQTLQHIVDADCDKEKCEVIVVAGGKDGTLEAAHKLSGMMQSVGRYVVLEQKPLGKNAAIQAGIRKARSPVLVLLDGDTFLSKNALKELTAPLEKDQSDLTIANPFPITRTWVSEYYMISKEYLLNQISTISGVAMALKTDQVRQRLDYFFDENVRVGVDYLLAKRLAEENRKILFVPAAKVITWMPTTLKYFLLNELRWLSAYIYLTGVKWQHFGMNLLILAGIVLLILPFHVWSLSLAIVIHGAYLFKKGSAFMTVFSRGKTKLKYFPGFLILSYAHHLVGLVAHLQNLAGFTKNLTLRQGERPT